MHDTAAAAGAHGWLGALSRVALSCGARTPCECLMQGIKDSPPPSPSIPIHPHPIPSLPRSPPSRIVQDRPGMSRSGARAGMDRAAPPPPSSPVQDRPGPGPIMAHRGPGTTVTPKRTAR